MAAETVDLYLRKSTKDEGRSVARQQHELTGAAADVSLTIGRTFVDPDLSASRFARKERPDYAALVEHVRSGACEVVGILEASRGSRGLTEWSTFLDLCRQQKVKIWVSSHQHVYDLSRRRDWRALADEGVDAADESEKLSERVLSGKRKAAREGKPAGRLQFGFTRVYDERGKLTEQRAHPAEAPIVAEMVRRVAGGETLTAVANDLNARGVTMPGGSPWAGRFVRQMILRPAYAGIRVHQGQEVGPAAWAPIVDVDEWRSAVGVLTRPERRSTTRGTALVHWLTNVPLCGACKSNRLTLHSGGAKAKPRYFCDPREGCGKLFAAAGPLEKLIEGAILARLSQPDAAEVFKPQADSTAALKAEAEAQALRDRLDEHYAEAAAGRLSARGLSAVEARLLPQIETAEVRARALATPPGAEDIDPAEVVAKWATWPPERRRAVVRAVVQLEVGPATRRGPGLDPTRLDGSRWARDEFTWGQRRALTT